MWCRLKLTLLGIVSTKFVTDFRLTFIGMAVSYTNSMLISIERRFGFSTKQTGMILAATELGHIAMALLVAHFVGTKNRPRWICFGTVLMGLAMFLFASPDIIFPLPTTVKQINGGVNGNSDLLCLVSTTSSKNASGFAISRTAGADTEPDNCAGGGRGIVGPLAVFCIAHILIGFGST